MTPIGYALENGDLETVKVLLEYGAAKGGQVGLDRMPPICMATSRNYYDIVQFLLDNRTRIITTDKFKRTPLLIAA